MGFGDEVNKYSREAAGYWMMDGWVLEFKGGRERGREDKVGR